MLKKLNKEIYEAEIFHNDVIMNLTAKRLNDLAESKTISEARIKTDASVQNKLYLESRARLGYLKREFSIAIKEPTTEEV